MIITFPLNSRSSILIWMSLVIIPNNSISVFMQPLAGNVHYKNTKYLTLTSIFTINIWSKLQILAIYKFIMALFSATDIVPLTEIDMVSRRGIFRASRFVKPGGSQVRTGEARRAYDVGVILLPLPGYRGSKINRLQFRIQFKMDCILFLFHVI